MPKGDYIKDDDIPQFARRCWQRYRDSTEDLRQAEKESLGFWVGGKYQWREGEIPKREGSNRPWMSINRCKPAVDQIENEARNNPPGPQCHPVGGGADKDGADILEGLIREYEYRSDANAARILALRYGAAGGQGCWEMATEYVSERSMEQQIVIKPIHDPSTIFYDPDSVLPTRQDSMFQGRLRKLNRMQVIEEFGPKLKILERGMVSNMLASVGSWLESATGSPNDWSSLNVWTGGRDAQGPFYVCEFWRVIIENVKLTLYDDGVLRFEDEDVPHGTSPKLDGKEKEIQRWSPRRKVMKYIITALDVVQKTEWLGDVIPIFWLSGPEMWRDGERFRLSAITGAQDSQRGLNYACTSGAETLGLMTKAPYMGPQGSFDVVNAQGFNPWKTANSTPWPYLEYAPVWVTDEATGESQLAPPPQRNTWEAPIARIMEFANFFAEQIKAATSVFFEPSVPSAAQAQSGAAIKELQSQTNIGTMNWQAALQQATALEYHQAAKVMRQIYDGPRVKAIVRADSQHEIAEINREFPGDNSVPKGEKRNDITNGQYAFRVLVGAQTSTDNDAARDTMLEVFKLTPQILANPQILSKFLRWLGEGNPEIEGIADIIQPDADPQSPQALQSQLMKAQQQNQAYQTAVQKLSQIIQTKGPELASKRWETQFNGLVKIRVAEIAAGNDTAQIDAQILEHLTGMAHERGMQAEQHAHEQSQTQAQLSAAAQSQASQQAADAAQSDNEPGTGV